MNQARPRQVLRILERHFRPLDGVRVGVLGLAFKPDTDDVRESPAIPIIELLLSTHASVKAYDPVAMPAARKVLGSAVAYAGSVDECIDGMEAVVLLTRWKEFDAVPGLLGGRTPSPLLLDGRRQLDKRAVPHYAGVGL